MLHDRYVVETPEIVDLAYDVAGIGSRCLAAMVDTLLLLLILGAVGLSLFLSIGQFVPQSGESLVLAVWALILFVALWGYYLTFEVFWSGQTPGKRLFGLRTVREGGRPITPTASLVRNLVRIVDFLPFGYGLGALVMFVDARSRRLGDLAAGTLVVREGATISLERLTAQATPVVVAPRAADAPATALVPNLQRISADEYELAQDFLRRRKKLAPQVRAHLASQLANALRQRLDLPNSGAPEAFIEHVIREYRVYHAATPDPLLPLH